MSKKISPLCVTKAAEVIDHEATGAKMRVMRMRALLSMTEMGSRLGMNLAQLSQMETGKRLWDEEKAARYVAALNGNA